MRPKLLLPRSGQVRWFAVGLVLSQLGTGAPALAECNAPARSAQAAAGGGGEGAAPAAASRAAMSRLYNQGIAALRAQQWDKARARLREAFAIEPLPEIAANLGHVEFMSGSFRDAAEHLSFYLRQGENISAADRKRMEAQIAEAKAKIGTVTVRVNVEGARVLVDRQEVGVSPIAVPVFVEPGRRVIEAKKEGLALGRESIEVTAGAAPVVELTLSKIEKDSAGPRVGVVAPPLESGSGRSWGLIGAGIGAGSVLVAIGFTAMVEAAVIRTTSREKWKNERCTRADTECRADFDASEGQHLGLRNVGLLAFVGAGVAGAGTLLYYALTGKSPAPKRTGRASLTVDVQSEGIVVKGHF